MTFEPPIPRALWDQVPPAAQAALTAVLRRYRQRIDALERRARDLEERLGQNSTNSSKPPSSDGPAVKRRPPQPQGQRPRGGQPGHPRHARPLLPPDHTEHLRPARCRRCGLTLRGDDPQPLVHQVLELPPIRPIVTEYRRHRLRCPRCHTTTCAALPTDVAGATCGPRLQAAVALLTGACRLSKRTASWVCRTLLGVPLSPAEVCGVERQVTAALAPAVAQAREHVRSQPTNVDETSWREGKKKGWLWAAVAASVTVFLIRLSRGAGALRDLLGAEHDRVVTSDRFTTYEVLPLERRQVCWAHLRRDFQAMIDRQGAGARVGEGLLLLSDAVFHDWHRVRDGTLRRQTFASRAESWYRPDVRAALEEGAACGCAKTSATCRELLAVELALWTFARVQGVEPTNNAVERALRGPVLWRKGSYGTDSAAGSRFVESILTAVASCRQQGRDVLEFITACCGALLHNTTPPSLIPLTER
jgi:transposase